MPPKAETVRVVDRAGAAALAGVVLSVMGELETVLARETEHVRAGRLREGLAEDGLKADLSARYAKGVAALKANAVALARFAPAEVDGLKAAHRRFAAAVETNQLVLATARTVSESLMRNLSDSLKKSTTPQVYGSRRVPSYGNQGAPRSAPLVLSRNL